MAKPGRNLYPDISGTQYLPIFLAGVGGTDAQLKVVREDGLNWHQIIRCGKGEGVLVADGVPTMLHEGDFILIPAGYPYEYHPTVEPWETNWVVFGGDACESLLKNLGLDRPTVVSINDNTTPRWLFKSIYVNVNSGNVFGQEIASGYVYDLILWFKQTILLNEMNRYRKNSQQILGMALEYIKDNVTRDVTLRELSDHIGISQQHMCRIFREHLNVHYTEYVTRIRLNMAMDMILNTDTPMAEIAKKCGFRSASYFSTVFGKYENMTPNNYRKRYKV